MLRVFASIVFAALATGCVADQGDESFIITGILAPPPTGESCVFAPNITGPYLSVGSADLLVAGSYRVAAQFESRVVAAEGKESLRRVDIQGANVTLDITPLRVSNGGSATDVGSPIQEKFQINFSTSILPNGGLAVGIFDVIPFDVMNRVVAAAGSEVDKFQTASAQATATIAPFGDFYGDRIEGTEFKFPISISNLQRTVLGTCPLPMATVIPEAGPCGFQDLVLPCCGQADGTVICPPTIDSN